MIRVTWKMILVIISVDLLSLAQFNREDDRVFRGKNFRKVAQRGGSYFATRIVACSSSKI